MDGKECADKNLTQVYAVVSKQVKDVTLVTYYVRSFCSFNGFLHCIIWNFFFFLLLRLQPAQLSRKALKTQNLAFVCRSSGCWGSGSYRAATNFSGTAGMVFKRGTRLTSTPCSWGIFLITKQNSFLRRFKAKKELLAKIMSAALGYWLH